MSIQAEQHPQENFQPVGVLGAASRWVVSHSGLATLAAVLLVGGLCVAQWWLAYQQAQDWDARSPGQPVPFRLFDTAGWALIISAGIWLGLWTLSGKETPTISTAGDAAWWRFDMRERQRIFEGRPVSRRFLWAHALFGLLGFVLGVALALRLAAAVGWQEQLLSRGDGPVGLVAFAIIVIAFAARRCREVLFLHDYDHLASDRAKEIAQAITEEERAEAESEREYERKTVRGWASVVLMGGLLGGLFLAYRVLPEAEGTTAFQGSVSGLVVGVSTVYVLKTKPRGRWYWLGLALACAVGFFIFTYEAWQLPMWYALLGVLWGVGVGVAATLLYLRGLRAGSPPTARGS